MCFGGSVSDTPQSYSKPGDGCGHDGEREPDFTASLSSKSFDADLLCVSSDTTLNTSPTLSLELLFNRQLIQAKGKAFWASARSGLHKRANNPSPDNNTERMRSNLLSNAYKYYYYKYQ